MKNCYHTHDPVLCRVTCGIETMFKLLFTVVMYSSHVLCTVVIGCVVNTETLNVFFCNYSIIEEEPQLHKKIRERACRAAETPEQRELMT